MIENIENTGVAETFPTSWYKIVHLNHFWFQWRLRAFLNFLKAVSPRSVENNWRVLDIGCGSSVVRQQLESETNWSVDGVDVEPECLVHPPALRGRVWLYDISQRNPELKEKYDAIVLFDVIEHIKDPGPFIEHALFHLKPGGSVFINVPALNSLYSKFDESVGHWKRYEACSLKSLCDPLLRRLETRYWGLTLVPVVFVRKIILGLVNSQEKRVEMGVDASPLVNILFKTVMFLETMFIKKPWVGSSVLLIGQKTEPN